MPFTKTYFLCPTSDFLPPLTGPLTLGAILTSTSSPQRPLKSDAIVHAADTYPPIVETDWRKTISHETRLGGGIYARFLQLMIGVGGEASIDQSQGYQDIFAFDTVTTLGIRTDARFYCGGRQGASGATVCA
jgi:hypothetical protein